MEKVKQEIRDIFLSRTREEWEEIFRDVDACVEPVISVSETLSSRNCMREIWYLKSIFQKAAQ